MSNPLFTPPPSDIAPHSRSELRAAYRERVNEAALDAEALYRGLTYSDSEEGIEACRNLIKMIESMRIMLERCGIEAPGIQYVEVVEED